MRQESLKNRSNSIHDLFSPLRKASKISEENVKRFPALNSLLLGASIVDAIFFVLIRSAWLHTKSPAL